MPTRRSVLTLFGTAVAAGSLWYRQAAAEQPPSPTALSIPLWPGQPPGGGGPSGDVHQSAKGAVTNIATPVLQVFAPTKPNGMAMLVAGGGGYKRIEQRNESLPAARWLNDRGITAFVLSYRLPSEGWTAGPLAPLQDAQRALRLIRSHADQWKIDPHRLGVLGFSAGGHLMGLAATRADFASYPAADAIDRQSARPDFAALIYPVITLEPPYDHTSTRKVLIGQHPDAAQSAEWSVETHVTRRTPPMFLAQAKDDPISNPENTLIMQAACAKAGVPVELHRLDDGGHGFGMGRPGTASMQWPGYFSAWLERQRGTAAPG